MTAPARDTGTPTLKDEIVRRIADDGPLTVHDYMALCLGHPAFGYYTRKDPFGEAGDFITAPEISQIFGELIGLWAIEVWSAMGAPDTVHLVELGPGRGTLMADALRAARLVPAFRAACAVHLVETSPVLRASQDAALAVSGVTPAWHDTIATVPPGPAIVAANEFLDALPVRQLVRRGEKWIERRVGVAHNDLVFCEGAPDPAAQDTIPSEVAARAGDGEIAEVRPAVAELIAAMAQRAKSAPLTALFIDYGHTHSAPGDTLQAIGRHDFADPLAAPGAHDLTAHVDFASLARDAVTAGFAVHGPIPQSVFLSALGLQHRCNRLMAGATPEQAADLHDGAMRLLDPGQMGTLFKAIALSRPATIVPPGFADYLDA